MAATCGPPISRTPSTSWRDGRAARDDHSESDGEHSAPERSVPRTRTVLNSIVETVFSRFANDRA